VDQTLYIGIQDEDPFEGYIDDADFNGLTKGLIWGGPWVDQALYAGMVALDSFEAYADGVDVSGLEGGTGFAVSWIDSFLSDALLMDDMTYPPLAFGLLNVHNRFTGGTSTPHPTQYTIAGWIRKVDTTPRNIACRSNGSPTSAWSHFLSTSTVLIGTTFDGVTKSTTGTTPLLPGVWYHVAVTARNSGTMQVYVNGVAEGMPVAIGTLWTGGNDWWVAAATGGGYSSFAGAMADLAIWSKELTAVEIAQLAAASLGEPLNVQPASLILHLPMQDEPYGANVTSNWDESVTGLTQTRSGTPYMVGGP
jgi:hypothetical protein